MKKLIFTILLNLFLSEGISIAHDENLIFLKCKGEFPNHHYVDNESIVKIDKRKHIIVFDDGHEYKSRKKWDVKSSDFDIYRGTTTTSLLKEMDHQAHFWVNRFTGEGMFIFSKIKKSNWKLMRETFSVKCIKVDRVL